jgi:hypothetical protein
LTGSEDADGEPKAKKEKGEPKEKKERKAIAQTGCDPPTGKLALKE